MDSARRQARCQMFDHRPEVARGHLPVVALDIEMRLKVLEDVGDFALVCTPDHRMRAGGEFAKTRRFVPRNGHAGLSVALT
jgi:hypothetical protein